VILGAGLAGLSLARALLAEGLRAPLLVIDRRRAFGRDRTWCWWDVAPTPWTALASRRWPRWRVCLPGAQEAVHEDPAHPYVHLAAPDFYAAALAALDAAPQAELRLGERVLEVDPDPERPRVRTDRETIEAARVYDALAGGSPLLRGRPAGEVELEQRFLGLEVELDRPGFDPGTVTLMDFRGARQDRGGLRFAYVLPFSPTRALVEDTSIGGPRRAPEERRAAVEAWLAAHTPARSWTVQHEERGRIPMTSAPFPAHHGPRVHAVGVAAGAVRPSSGYAFARTQAHCGALAAAVVRRGPLPAGPGHPRRAALDAIFLRALQADPPAFAERFHRLVAGTPAAAFARFMTDASSPADELRMIRALPPRPFLAAALGVSSTRPSARGRAARRATPAARGRAASGRPGAAAARRARPAG
jgi:lycopene beta-cyclase